MTRHVPLLGSCAVGGMGQAEIDALELDFDHNWGAGRVNPEAKRWRFTSLHGNGDQTGSGPWIIGNEPNVGGAGRDTDAMQNEPITAGRKAADLVWRLGVKQPIIGNLLDRDTWVFQRDYLRQYLDGYMDRMHDLGAPYTITPAKLNHAIGVHWYLTLGSLDVSFLTARLESYRVEAGRDIYITEMGIDMDNPPDWTEWSEYIDALLDWSADKPWFKAICLAQWPTRNHTTTLWKNDYTVWPGRLTPLGMTVRNMWADARADTTPDPEPEPEGENEWIHMTTTTWENEGWEYETTTRARRW